jgi:lipopolysaccharide heptosyltransferase I
VAQRILFIRLSALGDVVMTLPALAALRRARPDARVDWAVEDRFADLLGMVEGIDRVIPFPRRDLRGAGAPAALLRHLRALRRERYDAAIDFQGNLKGAMHLAACRATRKIGADASASREGAHRAADVRVPVPRGCHRVERALLLLAPLGVPAPRRGARGLDPALRPAFRTPGPVDDHTDAMLARVRRGVHPLVFLHPGTSAFGAFKRWPAERFGAVAARLRDELGADVLVTQGPGEEGLARAVVAASSGAAALCPPADGLPGLVSLLRRADILIAADSGPLQLASALGVACVALFGPKDPGVYAPPFAGSRAVRHAVPCSPCSLRDCDDPVCMTQMEPDVVFEQARELLGSAAER